VNGALINLYCEIIFLVKKRGKEILTPVTTKLSCQHHGLMTVSFGFLKYFFTNPEVKTGSVSGLLIGLGGGLLASFLINFMPRVRNKEYCKVRV
jgi:hypothetical protein